MSQMPDPATPTRICKVDKSLVGKKLRLAGRMLWYDAITGLIVIIDDKDRGVLTDISLCIDTRTSSWATERLAKVIILGYLENSETALPMLAVPAHAPAPEIDAHLVFRALLVVPAADLDLELWNNVIEEGEDAKV